jgi:hypothetical protein
MYTVHPTTLAVHTDLNITALEDATKSLARKLSTLFAVKDIRCTILRRHIIQDFKVVG